MPYVIYDVYNIHLIGGITIKMMQWEGLPREERFPFVYKKARPDTILNIRDYNGNIHMVSRKNSIDLVLTTETYEGPHPDFAERV